MPKLRKSDSRTDHVAREAVKALYSPDQPRDPDGKFGDGSGEHGGHSVGDMVKFSTPSIHYVSGNPVTGKSSQAGIVKRLLPGGKIEVRAQNGGYYAEHHSFFSSAKKNLQGEPMKNLHRVQITGLANASEMRTATFNDREHLVLPVVALVGDAVVRPMNSRGAEFVPTEELGFAPAAWNGRPVVPNHPNGGKSSANSPEMLEGLCFGRVFNARYEEGDLRMDAWLDVERARELGGDAEAVIERVLAGEMVEVSLGAWVSVEETPGVSPNGEKYDFIWRSITPDHLAMLPKGVRGACSIERGCGAPRAAQEIEAQTSTGFINSKSHEAQAAIHEREMKTMQEESTMKSNSLIAKARDFFTRLAAGFDDGQSDGALRGSLEQALRAVELGFMGVQEVYSSANACLYTVCPSTEWMTIHRTFTVADDGSVKLNDDRTPVSAQMRWVPMAEDGSEPTVLAGLAHEFSSLAGARHSASDMKMIQAVHDHARMLGATCADPKMTAAAQACACGGAKKEPAQPASATEGQPVTTPAKGGSTVVNENTKALVGKILASKDSPFDEGDRAKLEACSEEKLTALAARLGDSPKEPDLKELSEEQFMLIAPPSVRATLRAAKQREQARQKALIASLANAQSEYTAEVLAKKPVEELESLARMLDVADEDTDFSPLAAAAQGDESKPYVGPWTAARALAAK